MMGRSAEPLEGQIQVPPGDPFGLERADLRRTRAVLAYLLFALLAASVVSSLTYIGSEDSWTRAKEFLQIALPAEIGLLGGAIGFYFGSESARTSSGE
jgi:hypothetical protein